ncbi:hypothetical protein ENHYD8BJ_290003 [Enhydrobacter sp. 8BJ]|nr:hypothetical protein ENHYD8BJ_290003 [Enhydrobacter sp. 8BJ]
MAKGNDTVFLRLLMFGWLWFTELGHLTAFILIGLSVILAILGFLDKWVFYPKNWCFLPCS